jgi:hypothetical protein
MNIDKLQYMTMAEHLRGYAEGLLEGYQGEARHGTLARTLNKAADLLQAVWDENNPPDEKFGGTE